ncbi:Uncharacterised protein [Mycobacteroides abscessus]|nr:Uncharacterised protein [Mycobacteroides abscessus]
MSPRPTSSPTWRAIGPDRTRLPTTRPASSTVMTVTPSITGRSFQIGRPSSIS